MNTSEKNDDSFKLSSIVSKQPTLLSRDDDMFETRSNVSRRSFKHNSMPKVNIGLDKLLNTHKTNATEEDIRGLSEDDASRYDVISSSSSELMSRATSKHSSRSASRHSSMHESRQSSESSFASHINNNDLNLNTGKPIELEGERPRDHHRSESGHHRSGSGHHRSGSGHHERPREEHLSRAQIAARKRTMLTGIECYQEKGCKSSRAFAMSDDYEDIKNEFERIKSHYDRKSAVKIYGKYLVTTVSMIEYGNKAINDPFGIDLEGWSAHVAREIDEYDDIFEELYIKWQGEGNLPPELRLLFMVVSSGFTHCIARAAVNKASAAIPGFGDVMSANPELQRQYEVASNRMVKSNGNMTPIHSTLSKVGLGDTGQLLGGLTQQNYPTQDQSNGNNNNNKQTNNTSTAPMNNNGTRQKLHIDPPKDLDNLLGSITDKTPPSQK
jgi:hypothetical protein